MLYTCRTYIHYVRYIETVKYFIQANNLFEAHYNLEGKSQAVLLLALDFK